jgi:hypothetical protein
LAAVVVGAAAGADVAGADVGATVVELELWLELPHAVTNKATAATTNRPTGRNRPTLTGRRDTRELVIGATLVDRY